MNDKNLARNSLIIACVPAILVTMGAGFVAGLATLAVSGFVLKGIMRG